MPTMPAAAEESKANPRTLRVWLYLTPPIALLALFFVGANLLGWADPRDTPPIAGTLPGGAVDDQTLAEVHALVSAAANTRAAKQVRPTSARLGDNNHGVYAALRSEGRKVIDGWNDGGAVGPALETLVANLAARAAKHAADRSIDTVEICLTHSFRETEGHRRALLSNIHRGVRGIEIDGPRGAVRFSPTEMLARNLKFRKTLDEFAAKQGMSARDISDSQLRSFECDQILVDLDAGNAVSMQRGNIVVPLASVDRKTTEALTAGMANWLLTHVHPDGRMTYKWWPSQGNESQANNMIRQWMASVALVRHGVRTRDPVVLEAAQRNIDYNLRQFYRQDQAGRGMILFHGKAKLGAAALAAMAILQHPNRERWAEYEKRLTETIFYLQNKNGSFTTFLVPKGRNDIQNFYPGEALYYLALKYDVDRTPELIPFIMRGFKYYRRWHLDPANRNPAFCPWHIQAYYNVWRHTKDPELADFVFEMSDFIAGFQQWDSAIYDDSRGRFYDPRRRHYGPPHASSTGVYIEGLIDAFAMARELGDGVRMARYRRAIVRGIRSLQQLQFVDDVDMFYVHQKDLVRGGVRTTLYDNGIRVDNVQHGFMGLLKTLDRFTDEDFAAGRQSSK
jgi:hypothetical protein